ncbi:MAG TPA: response regulator transcription factor [Bacteroidota bacterium]|nr:response regulator transcription factor [Bacteroidota bacterium]
MITVGIVEDDKDIRSGIQKYLNHQKEFLCEIAAESVEEFLAKTQEGDFPDVILSDIGLPGMSGTDGMRLIKERHPDVDIIMLTVYNDWQKIFDSLRAGASGYLLKNTPLTEIKKAIETVRAGGSVMSPEIARKVMEHFTAPAVVQRHTAESVLTPKEKEIVIGLVDGLSYKMLADRMNISIDTIRFHIKNIYKKLHVNSKAEVITKSLRGEI